MTDIELRAFLRSIRRNPKPDGTAVGPPKGQTHYVQRLMQFERARKQTFAERRAVSKLTYWNGGANGWSGKMRRI